MYLMGHGRGGRWGLEFSVRASTTKAYKDHNSHMHLTETGDGRVYDSGFRS